MPSPYLDSRMLCLHDLWKFIRCRVETHTVSNCLPMRHFTLQCSSRRNGHTYKRAINIDSPPREIFLPQFPPPPHPVPTVYKPSLRTHLCMDQTFPTNTLTFEGSVGLASRSRAGRIWVHAFSSLLPTPPPPGGAEGEGGWSGASATAERLSPPGCPRHKN